jgi:phosphatidylglycerophosphatase A
MRRLAVLVCSFGYVGFFPIAPGTAGSAAGVVVYLICRGLGLPHFELPLIVALFVVGVLAGGAAEKALGGVDPGPVVIDEVMGMLMTLFLIPVNWVGLILGFVLFRIFDVIKPYPARRFEQFPGGLGMMADDAMAAVYANLLLHAVYYLAPNVVS